MYTTVFMGNFLESLSKCLMIFSDKITPTSTIVPMAMAIPERATMLASTLNAFIAIKTIRTATGNKPEMRIEALKLRTITTITKIVIRISRVKASFNVPKVS